MATINSVISTLRGLKMVTFSDETLAGWLAELDAQISLEVLHQPEATAYTFPDDGDAELLAPAPYDGLYLLHLLAQVDSHNDEMDRYTNSYIMFNSAFSDWKKYYLRTNLPPPGPELRNIF